MKIPPLVSALNLQLRAGPSVRLASQTVLGCHLEHLRQTLGYAGEGSWQAYREESKSGERLRWPDLCKQQAGISDAAAKIYWECHEAIKDRLRRWDTPESILLLELMLRPPLDLSAADRARMIHSIASNEVMLGDNQTALREHFRRMIQRQQEENSRKGPVREIITQGMDNARKARLVLRTLFLLRNEKEGSEQ